MERLQNNNERHESQRGYFAHALYNEMIENPDIWVITADLGYAMLDHIKEDFPERFINVGAAEQSALGISIGLAQEQKIPFVYTISSFYLRAAEQISLYVSREQIPVKMIGGGRGDDYKHDGPSHNSDTLDQVMKVLEIPSLFPETKEEIPLLVHDIIGNDKPTYLNLRR